METLDRRQFTNGTLSSLLTFCLLETLFETEAFADEVRPITAQWLADVNTLSQDLKGARLTQTQWQERVESLLKRIDLPDLLTFLDFKALTKGVRFRDQGELSLRPKFPKVEGLPTELVYGRQVFALKRGQSVVPHGHDNMATAFVVLDGQFHGRHYDRLDEDKKTMIVRPTIDRKFRPGEFSTISDDRDNVHWFKATSESGFLFNFHVLGVTPGRRTGRVYVDPNGEKLSDDRVRVRKIKAPEAYKLFG